MTDLEQTVDQLAHEIVARIEQGDKAADKAEQHYISAGRLLKDLKARKPAGVTWPKFARGMCNLSQQRADELIRIADGKTTLDEVRAGAAERKKRAREKAKEADQPADQCDVTLDGSEPASEESPPSDSTPEPEPEPEPEPPRPPEPGPPPSPPQDEVLLTRFSSAVLELIKLCPKPASKFVGTSISAGDLEMVSNFLAQIARAKGPKAEAA